MKKSMQRAIRACVLGTVTLAANDAVAGMSNKQLLDVLLENGAINQKQYDMLLKEATDEKVATRDDVKTSLEKGALKFQTEDEAFKFQVGGRVMADAAWYSEDEGLLGDGTEIRRARLFVTGTVWNDWHFKGQYDFAGDGTSIKDAYLKYSGFEHYIGVPLDITVGNFKEPFGLEELTSSKYITFMERSTAIEAFAPSRNIGLAFNSNGNLLGGSWTAASGWFSDGIDKTSDNGEDESYGVVGRLTAAPIANETQLVHLGGAIEYRKLKGNDFQIRARPESHIADERLVSVTVPAAEDILRYGAEAAAVWGPFSVQGEYIMANVDSETGPDGDFDGWYAQTSWFLTGESRAYKNEKGSFDRVKPKGIVGKGGWGAWELAARYSYLDLNDSVHNGGVERNWTFGVNWHATPTVRLMANYVLADTKNIRPGSDGVNIDPDILQIHAQVDF